jgi:hypothetical protein
VFLYSETISVRSIVFLLIDFTKEMHSGLPESRQDAGWHRIFVIRQSLLSAGILGVFQAR